MLRAEPSGAFCGMLLVLHSEGTEELPVAAENAEAPGLIKVVISIYRQPFHL